MSRATTVVVRRQPGSATELVHKPPGFRVVLAPIAEDAGVVERDAGQCLLYIDRHLCHDGSFNGFKRLRALGEPVKRPLQTFLTPDHYTPTSSASLDVIEDPKAKEIVLAVDRNARDFGVHVFPWGDPRQGN